MRYPECGGIQRPSMIRKKRIAAVQLRQNATSYCNCVHRSHGIMQVSKFYFTLNSNQRKNNRYERIDSSDPKKKRNEAEGVSI